MRLIESMADGRKAWLQSRHRAAGRLYDGWTQWYTAYSLGRLCWQAEGDAMQAYCAHLKYDMGADV